MTDLLSLPADRSAIAERLAARLGNVSAEPLAAGELEIGESFPVHILRRDHLKAGRRRRRIGHVVGQAPYWHLQLRSRGTPIVAAHARPESKKDWEVVNIFGAELAPKIGAAIRWVDKHMPEPGVARMLLIPEKRLFALWIEQRQRDRIVLINGARRTRGLSTQQGYTVHQFLKGVFGRYVRSGTGSKRSPGSSQGRKVARRTEQ